MSCELNSFTIAKTLREIAQDIDKGETITKIEGSLIVAGAHRIDELVTTRETLQQRIAKLGISEEEMMREFERQSIEHSLYAGIELEFDHKRDCYKKARAHYGWQMFRAAVNMMQERCK